MSDRYGVHVKPVMLNIALRCLGADNIVLITDSMNMTGSPPGTYPLQDGRKVTLEEGGDTLRLENGDLAGSVMTMDAAVRNFVAHTGCTVEQAVQMASFNPARSMGLSSRKGEIKPGMDADIILFSKNIDIKMTIVQGVMEYDGR
jgi:N-acetylglucosamine-6-phosphate deacetylase